MGVPGFERLGVLCRRGAPHAGRLAHHQRHAPLAAEHVARLCRLIDQLVDGTESKIGEAQLDHGAGADERRTDGGSHDGRFGDGGVEDAPWSELLGEILVLAEDPAAAEILAERPD